MRLGSKLYRTIFTCSKIVALLLVPVALVMAAGGAPSWLLRAIGATVFIGLPFVMVLAWALSSEPIEGAKRAPWESMANGD